MEKGVKITIGIIVLFVVLFFAWEVFVPKSFETSDVVIYEVKKGEGSNQIAKDLQNTGIIKRALFFKMYAVLTGKYGKLQAGNYEVSSSMSVAEIVDRISMGDVIKKKLTFIEGWSSVDIKKYVDSKGFFDAEDFHNALSAIDQSQFSFLEDKPKNRDLEGYVFPDTYVIPANASAEYVVGLALENFGKKLTPELRAQIIKDKKSIFKIVTMASIIEKEVQTIEDKKIVSGILWKRIEAGVPLQVDASINYITGKNSPGASFADLKIDSPYNTYKYYGLPFGPISNPGLDSILASIYPEKSEYWYYLSDPKTGKTIFSKTLDEHNAAIVAYLR